jgi:hypothetical protein
MDINFPPVVRKTIYIIVVIGTAVLVPLNIASIVPDVAMNVWNSVAGAASLLAAFNVNKK